MSDMVRFVCKSVSEQPGSIVASGGGRLGRLGPEQGQWRQETAENGIHRTWQLTDCGEGTVEDDIRNLR